MNDAAQQIDATMETASQALVANRYLECERLCMAALQAARRANDFERISRILLPLQEARRQRRQIAEDAGTVVLTSTRNEVGDILEAHRAGCLLLTDPPYTQADGDALREAARQRELFVEVLVMDSAALTGAFCWAMEQVGDAAIASLPPEGSPVEQVDALLGQLDRIGDHELAHQRLAQAAQEAACHTAKHQKIKKAER